MTLFRMVFIVMSAFTCASCTTPVVYDENHPAHAWAADCAPQMSSSLKTWVFLQCKLTNRSKQLLTLHPLKISQTERDIWRQPERQELQQLKHDLQVQQTVMNLPLLLGAQGGERLESFLAQVVVVSGVWLLKANNKREVSEVPNSDVKVEAGKSVDQVFVLYRESFDRPEFVVLQDTTGAFVKRVVIPKDPAESRQRPTSP